MSEELGGVGEGGVVDASGEHARHLLQAVLAGDAVYAGYGASGGLFLGDDDVGVGFRGDLGQVGDGEDLVAFAELAQLGADGRGGLAADACVYLVEDVRGARLDALLGEADGEHDPRELAAGGVAPDGELGLPRVRPDLELDPLSARWPRL